MKLAVFSDIHGNIWGFKEALRRLEGCSFDRMIFLGDIFGYYYRQREVFEELRKLPDLIWLLGNHDRMFLEAMDGAADEARLISRYGHSYADIRNKGFDDIAAFLRTLRPQAELDAEGTRVLCVHGTPWDPLNGRMYPDNPVKNPESYAPFDIVLQGHTHCRMKRFTETGQTLIVNPGSVGQPRDGRGYSFAIVDTGERSVSFVPYEIDRRPLYSDIDRYDPDLEKLKAVLERRAAE